MCPTEKKTAQSLKTDARVNLYVWLRYEEKDSERAR